MKHSPSSQADVFRASAHDAQLGQFVDLVYPPTGRRQIIANFRKLKLERIDNNQQLFEGQVILRFDAGITSAGLAILQRLLNDYRGWFLVGFDGTYNLQQHYADVTITNLPTVNMQPVLGPTTASAPKIVLIDPVSGGVRSTEP